MIIGSPHILSDRFERGALIGTGSSAEIYRATDVTTGESVAIKVLRSEHAQDPTLVSRFEQEAEIGGTFSHQNIVTSRLLGRDKDSRFIVMDLVRGISLRRRLHLTGSISPPDAVRIILGVLSGLEVVHQAGYIHRDIKPQNILLEATGIPKIADFGIAIRQGEPGTDIEGLALGTAAYIAPEQAAGLEVGPGADLYAVGAVLFEMLTGQAPFPGDDPIEVMERHLCELPPDPREINPEVSPALATIIIRALAKKPENRYSSASEMRGAIETLLPEAESSTGRRLDPLQGLIGYAREWRQHRRDVDGSSIPSAGAIVPALLMTVLFIVLVLGLVSTGDSHTAGTNTAAAANSTVPASDSPSAGSHPSTTLQAFPSGWSASAAVSRPRESTVALENASATAAVSAAATPSLTIYDNSLAAGWDTNLSWSASVELATAATPHSNATAIRYTPTGAWAGLQLRHDGTVNTAPYSAIQFSVRSTRNGERLAIYMRDSTFQNLSQPVPLARYGGYPTATSWTTYTIPLADLNASNVSLGSIVIHSWTNRPQSTFYVNDVRLLSAAG